MNPITKVAKNLDTQQYCAKHLSIIHVFLPEQLTKKEIEVLASFMALEGQIAEQDRFGTQCRKLVMAKQGIQPGGLGNYLRSLEDKQYIFKQDGSFVVSEHLIPEKGLQTYQFAIKEA